MTSEAQLLNGSDQISVLLDRSHVPCNLLSEELSVSATTALTVEDRYDYQRGNRVVIQSQCAAPQRSYCVVQ